MTKYLLDTSIIKPANLFPSKKKQKIIYHLLVTKWEEPSIFSLAVVVGNDTLQYFQDTSSLTDWYIGQATTTAQKDSALSNKKKCFLVEMGGTALQDINLSNKETDVDFFKKDCRGCFYSDLPSKGFSKTKINTLYLNFLKYYKGKIIHCLAPPGDGPEAGSALFAYHPDLKKLVRIYSP